MAVNFKNLAAFVTAIVAVVAVTGEARLVARADSVTVFHDVNYRGHWVFAPNSNGACHNVAGGENDKISSIKVGPDTNCVFYADYNCSGKSLAVHKDIPDLRSVGFNDIISSFNSAQALDKFFMNPERVTPSQPTTPSNVSVVDFAPFLSGVDKDGVAKSIVESFKQTGFVYLLNHGLDTEKVDTMFGWSKKFFGLPLEVKQLAPHPPSGAHHRGYSAPGREQVKHLSESDSSDGSATIKEPADMKESFESGRDDDPRMPNIWLPEGTLLGFKEACMDFYWACYQVELTILRALALGLNAPEDYFDQYHTAADNQLRLLHYPSVPADELRNERLGRIGAHSDFCTLTLLLQDDVGGLEVEDPNKPGTFLPVPPFPGSLVVNVGDFLMRWSNDTFRSTIHRVRSPVAASSTQNGIARERYSIPYFCSADLSTVVDCIPGTWSADRPKKYQPTSALEYIIKRLEANY